MSKDLAGFAAAKDRFAVRFQREDLPGLLRRRLDVPEGTLALVRQEGGEAQVLTAGGSASELKDGVLVKERCRLELEAEAGRSKDDLPFRVKLELDLRVRPAALDLGQLEQAFLQGSQEAEVAAVQDHFAPYLRDALRFFTGSRPAEALATADQRQAVEDHLRSQLEKPLFESGLELVEVRHPSFTSSEFDARRQAEAAARDKARDLEREQQLVDLKKQLDLKELLAGVEVQDEADRARKERRLQRYEDLRKRMGDDDVKALILMLDDDGQRARLIRELIDKDLTPEQRAAMKLGEMEDRVSARLHELQQRLAQLTGAALERREGDPVTRRVLCVVGKRVLAFDPKTDLHPEVPKEVYDTEGGALGYLRSVRQERVDGSDWLLVGSQRGVYRLSLSGEERREYPFPREPEGKGGANAVAYFDGRLFATHSELGLIEWPMAGGPARQLCQDVTQGASATRGVLVRDGVLYFSCGSEVLALDAATGSERPTRFKGSDDSITAFCVGPDEVVAGNRAGRIYRWTLDDPGSPHSFGVTKKNPIYMLRHTVIAGQGFYVVGSKDFTVTVAEPRKDLYREYQAREEVRWVDGASDYVVGVSRSGYKVFCWDTLRQSEPKLTIRVSDKIQDLFLARALAKA